MVERDSGELLLGFLLFAMMPVNMTRGATPSVLEPVPVLARRAPLFGALLALAIGLAACGKKADDSAPAQSAESTTATSGNQYQDPSVDFPITEPPAAQKASGNPFKDVKLFVDPESLAQLRVNALKKDHPDKAAIIEKIAKQPQALWLGEWNTNIYRTVQFVVGKAKALGEVPVFIAYNVPGRDCGQHSAGGLKDDDAYKRWIRRIAAGIGEDSAVVILEPDAIPLLDKCLTPEQQEERLSLIKDAVRVLRQNPKTIVYIDGGHAVWKPAEDIAERLKKAGVEEPTASRSTPRTTARPIRTSSSARRWRPCSEGTLTSSSTPAATARATRPSTTGAIPPAARSAILRPSRRASRSWTLSSAQASGRIGRRVQRRTQGRRVLGRETRSSSRSNPRLGESEQLGHGELPEDARHRGCEEGDCEDGDHQEGADEAPREAARDGSEGLAPSELVIAEPSEQVAELTERVRADGGEVLSLYRDPLGAHALCSCALPIDKVKPTPFQRDVSEAHVRKLTVAMGKTKRFLDPIIAVRQSEIYFTPNGHHRLVALRSLGARSVIALWCRSSRSPTRSWPSTSRKRTRCASARSRSCACTVISRANLP